MIRNSKLQMTAVLAAGALLGWLAAAGWLNVTVAQEKKPDTLPPEVGTPSVLPRPELPFQGKIGRTVKGVGSNFNVNFNVPDWTPTGSTETGPGKRVPSGGGSGRSSPGSKSRMRIT